MPIANLTGTRFEGLALLTIVRDKCWLRENAINIGGAMWDGSRCSANFSSLTGPMWERLFNNAARLLLDSTGVGNYTDEDVVELVANISAGHTHSWPMAYIVMA